MTSHISTVWFACDCRGALHATPSNGCTRFPRQADNTCTCTWARRLCTAAGGELVTLHVLERQTIEDRLAWCQGVVECVLLLPTPQAGAARVEQALVRLALTDSGAFEYIRVR